MFVSRAWLSERPRCSPRGMEEGGEEREENSRGENEPSRGRQIARGGEFTIFRCAVSYEALHFHLTGTRCGARALSRLLFTRTHQLVGSLNNV